MWKAKKAVTEKGLEANETYLEFRENSSKSLQRKSPYQ